MSGAFLALLSAYYLCDAAASLQPLPPQTAQACVERYEMIKDEFHPEGEVGPAARRAAYLRFKAWEADNAALVRTLRANAAVDARIALKQRGLERDRTSPQGLVMSDPRVSG